VQCRLEQSKIDCYRLKIGLHYREEGTHHTQHAGSNQSIQACFQAIIYAGVVALLAAISVATYIAPASSQANPSGLFPDGINPANVAWTLAATSLQLLLMAGNGNLGEIK